MRAFFSQYITYSKYIFKFWVTQIAMSAFGLLVSLATISTEANWMVIISSLFAIGFLCFLLYDMMFMYGLKHSVNKQDFVPNKLEGLKIAFLSYLPTAFLVFLAVLFYIFGLHSVYSIIKIVLIVIINGTYNGFWWLLSGVVYDPLIAIFTLLPGTVACTLGYYLGLRDLPIRKLLGIPVNPPKHGKNK